ncbi:hypothetical protein [Corallococcus macrosporus]|uniref:Uncharacterized protein n=1 Tax=Corallococcus macrosporus DSM 14697 TaxID=1189310 RepID=A0A250K6M1_9BACT|nr:hypothetical protein [Corallococcus macrosporus]ATB51086.1 hypothetical protein MYMAC_006743 [Corallococcus macrosporus DSM 14697]
MGTERTARALASGGVPHDGDPRVRGEAPGGRKHDARASVRRPGRGEVRTAPEDYME